MELQGALNRRNNMEIENKITLLTFPDFKTYSKLQSVKGTNQHKERPINWWNRFSNTKINSKIYS